MQPGPNQMIVYLIPCERRGIRIVEAKLVDLEDGVFPELPHAATLIHTAHSRPLD